MIKLGGLVNLKPLHEAESDKYTHIGYGKYKEKGKEKDDKAPTFKKDGEKFVPISNHAAAAQDADAKDTKKVNIFNKDKEEPKKDEPNQDTPKDNPFGVDRLVYNKRTKTVGIVRMADDGYGEVKTDADGNVDVDELEPYNPMKYPHQKDAKVAPSTSKEIDSRGLFQPFAQNGPIIREPKAEPKQDEPKSEPQVKPRPADKVLTKTVDKFSKKLGLSPEKLGKEEYEKRMLSYVHDALEDANFHSANRQIFADLQGRPELAKRPDYSTAPDVGTPEREEWDMKNSIYNKNFDASVSEFDNSDEAVGALTSQASWEGEKIIDSLLDKLRKDGSGELADKIQISFDKDMAKNEGKLKLGDLV